MSNKINTTLQQHRFSMSNLKLSQIQIDILYIVTTELGIPTVLRIDVFYIVEQHIREGLAQILFLHRYIHRDRRQNLRNRSVLT